MISHGYSVRYWQMIEAGPNALAKRTGRPFTLFTLLRISETFGVAAERILTGLASHLWKAGKPPGKT